MKISKSKQELARIISENGGWSYGAEWVAQDKDGDVFKFDSKPVMGVSREVWMPTGNGCTDKLLHCATIKGWHQTILSRAEYFHLYLAPDADGWIEWSGGECPVDGDCIVSYKMRDAATFKRGEPAREVRWAHNGAATDIIAYRMHKPEQSTVESRLADAVDIVKSAAPALMRDDMKFTGDEVMGERKPTIERLASDYRNAKDYAERKRQEADAAKADADAKLKELELAGEALGLNVSPITAKKEPELVITDWQDLRVGDEVEYLAGSLDYMTGRVGVVCDFDESHPTSKVRIASEFINKYHQAWPAKWRFIRRP